MFKQKIGKAKLSKALGLELLKDQVETLETNIQKMRNSALKIVIFDSEMYIHHLRTIKAALMSWKFIVIRSQDGTTSHSFVLNDLTYYNSYEITGYFKEG